MTMHVRLLTTGALATLAACAPSSPGETLATDSADTLQTTTNSPATDASASSLHVEPVPFDLETGDFGVNITNVQGDSLRVTFGWNADAQDVELTYALHPITGEAITVVVDEYRANAESDLVSAELRTLWDALDDRGMADALDTDALDPVLSQGFELAFGDAHLLTEPALKAEPLETAPPPACSDPIYWGCYSWDCVNAAFKALRKRNPVYIFWDCGTQLWSCLRGFYQAMCWCFGIFC